MNGNKTERVPALIKPRVYIVQEGSLRPAKGACQERSKKKTTCKTIAASQVRESLIHSLIHAFIGFFKNINLVLLRAGHCSRTGGYSNEQNQVPALKGHTYR